MKKKSLKSRFTRINSTVLSQNQQKFIEKLKFFRRLQNIPRKSQKAVCGVPIIMSSNDHQTLPRLNSRYPPLRTCLPSKVAANRKSQRKVFQRSKKKIAGRRRVGGREIAPRNAEIHRRWGSRYRGMRALRRGICVM